MREIVYPVLEGKIAERGIRRSAIATRLGITTKAFYNKMNGDSPFTWDEVRTMQMVFFPDQTKDALMQRSYMA